MFISVTMKAGDEARDVRIDADQRIAEALTVLRQAGKLPAGRMPDFFMSRLEQRPVSAYRTFAEEQVFDGDVLTVV